MLYPLVQAAVHSQQVSVLLTFAQNRSSIVGRVT